MSQEKIDFHDIPSKAAELVQIIGSVALDGDFVFSESSVEEVLRAMKLLEMKQPILSKLTLLGVIKKD
jgi:hypothetical protein